MASHTWMDCITVRKLVLGTVGVVLSHSLVGVQRKPQASLAYGVDLACHVPSIVFENLFE